ncbi:putative phage abortive infection protein [Enterococcus faecium]
MKNKYLNWVAIALGFVVIIAFILASFKAEEGWLGFWGGIIGSAIGVLGAFLVLKEQVNYDRDALKEQLNEEKEQNRKQQIDNTFFNLLSMHNEQINDLKGKNKFGKVYKELGRNLKSAMSTSLHIYLHDNKDIVTELNKLKQKYEEHINKNQHKIPNTYAEEYNNFWIKQRKRPPFIWWTEFNRDNIADAIDEVLLIEDMISAIENDNISKVSGIISNFRNIDACIKKFEFEKTETWNTLYNNVLEYETNKFTLIDEELGKETVENVLSSHYDEVGAYFRLFHRIIKYINDNLDQSEELTIKNNYIGFLRATVNEEEMLVIFYNAAYTKRGQGLLDELQKTTFFGNREDIMNNQHFDRKKLFWEENDVNKMLEKKEN